MSVRLELVALLQAEVDYRSPSDWAGERSNWAAVVLEMLADREMFGQPPVHLEAETSHGNAVLRRWRRMYSNNLYKKARKAVA